MMNEKFFGRGVAMLLGVLLLTSTASAQVARHGWRGPERTGIYPETGLLKQWPASGPEQLWEVLDAVNSDSMETVQENGFFIYSGSCSAGRFTLKQTPDGNWHSLQLPAAGITVLFH